MFPDFTGLLREAEQAQHFGGVVGDLRWACSCGAGGPLDGPAHTSWTTHLRAVVSEARLAALFDPTHPGPFPGAELEVEPGPAFRELAAASLVVDHGAAELGELPDPGLPLTLTALRAAVGELGRVAELLGRNHGADIRERSEELRKILGWLVEFTDDLHQVTRLERAAGGSFRKAVANGR